MANVNTYLVTAAGGLSLPPQMPIALDDRQLERRKHQVRGHALEGFYVSDERLTFKAGEKIVVEGELPKNLAALTDQPMGPSEPTPVKVDKGKPARDKSKR